MLGNSMLGSTYLSPLKTQVISHNVKTIKSKNIASQWTEAGPCHSQIAALMEKIG